MERTHINNTLQKVGQQVILQGWVNSKRDHGKITFIDLRDETGQIQVVGEGQLGELHIESVVEVKGVVTKRASACTNSAQDLGEIELQLYSYRLLNDCKELPITLEGDGREINEMARLKYRYLDLRRPRMQKNLRLRSSLTHLLREALIAQRFVEIETPLLTKATKEGARDFLVPARFHPGSFYALPQSPQQYKQLLMTAGFERYFQFAKCVRDEDLRADRGFEFTQLDLEMSYVSQQQVMQLTEATVTEAVKKLGGHLQQEPFPVFSYQEAMTRFQADKFDLRSPQEVEQGVLAFAWVIDFPFFKKVDKADRAEVADGKSGWTFTHNPFSSPQSAFLEDHLQQQNIDKILTAQYDLVCNGHEVGGGSIRAYQPEVLRSTFKIMGYSDTEIEASIGHMLEAFELGTPPHGGIALGLDRLVMLMTQESSLKEAIAFPMSASGKTAIMDAPTKVHESQLVELGLQLKVQETASVHDRILSQLADQGYNYRYLVHAPVVSSEEAAKQRGHSLSESAKSLVVDVGQELAMVVVPGDKRANLDALKTHLGVRRVSMAAKEQVEAVTGLSIGAIPPLGSIFSLKTYLDEAFLNQSVLYFNNGRQDRSISLSLNDFMAFEKPQLLPLS